MSENFVDERLELVSLVFRLTGKEHFIEKNIRRLCIQIGYF